MFGGAESRTLIEVETKLPNSLERTLLELAQRIPSSKPELSPSTKQFDGLVVKDILNNSNNGLLVSTRLGYQYVVVGFN